MVAMVMEKGILGRGDTGAEAWGTGGFGCRMAHAVFKLRIWTFEIKEPDPQHNMRCLFPCREAMGGTGSALVTRSTREQEKREARRVRWPRHDFLWECLPNTRPRETAVATGHSRAWSPGLGGRVAIIIVEITVVAAASPPLGHPDGDGPLALTAHRLPLIFTPPAHLLLLWLHNSFLCVCVSIMPLELTSRNTEEKQGKQSSLPTELYMYFP